MTVLGVSSLSSGFLGLIEAYLDVLELRLGSDHDFVDLGRLKRP
jgi:hypothetical protein